MARLTWVLAVAGLTTSRSAISSLDSPSAARAMTSRSRSVSASSAGVDAGCLDASAKRAISRRVTPGESSASPRATARRPWISSTGSVFFTRKPLAPARSASNTYSSRSKVVRITMRTAPRRSSAAILRVAPRPSSPGMRMSISTRSGSRLAVRATASSPSPASPTTSMSSCASSSARNPARTSTWSSTSSTLITGPPPSGSPGRRGGSRGAVRLAVLPVAGEGQAGQDLEAAARAAAARAAAVVVHLHGQVGVAVGDADGGARRAGVPGDVGEGLLHDAEGGQVDAGGQRPWLALDPGAHRQAGGRRAGDQVVQAGQPGRRRPRRRLVDLAQHVEHGAQLAERLVAGLLDRGEGGAGLLGPLVD